MRQKSELQRNTFIQGIVSSRKGMGMELALLVLLVVFACSIMLVSSAMLGKSNLNDRRDSMLQRLELNRIAEQLMAGETVNNEKYVVTRRENNVWEIADANGQIMLVVSWENGVITRWDYN